ncbi:cytochrome P450 CYP749A22-like [Cynara cardunculus var. scolymus]|uniref:cytochrome P450 CYP749A22-like n=1 Tax=Cynara cardunculus var. scolymus TaxID=59895 RepID=UPI000D6301CA|nr:cytochrome P450 CYP749A22-like [Cynara cardunculus var. scolymus]
MALVLALVVFVSTLFLLRFLLRFVVKVWWTPVRIQKMMKSQGIGGLPYAFPHGNTRVITAMRNRSMNQPMEVSHDIFSRIQPHVHSWIKIYGINFVNWHGSQPQLFITDPELVKEILSNREGAYPKMDMEGYAKKLLGEALITNEGEKWEKVRKLANRTFHAESLKNMVPEMSSSVEAMLGRWKDYEGQEIDVHTEFGVLTTEVISRTAFGSSYVEGKHIFEMVSKLTAITVRNIYNLRFPGISSILKTDDEIEAERLEQTIKKSILEIVMKRKASMSEGVDEFGSSYLGQLVKIADDSNGSKRISIEQMIDEIKAIYGAGHLTTTNLLSWTVFLLAIDQDWQDKAREEVFEFFGRKTPTSDGIARLKTMNMVINESLRLYPPVLTMTRKVEREIKLGNLTIPANINIFISILALHHNPEIWGNDVLRFRPERFANGVARATKNNPAAFLPFGMGPRTCVGLNFTTNEAKIALSMILQRYRFTISSNYVHYPADVFILTPKKGVQVILHDV